MPKRQRTRLLELPDASGGIADLPDGTRVFWCVRLGPRLVARRTDGTTRVVDTATPGPVNDAFVELCDRGVSVTRRLTAAETRELEDVIRTYGPQPGGPPPGAKEAP